MRNVAGLLVRRLVDELASPGFYSVRWDGRNEAGQPVSSGVYYYMLDIGPITQYRKLLSFSNSPTQGNNLLIYADRHSVVAACDFSGGSLETQYIVHRMAE